MARRKGHGNSGGSGKRVEVPSRKIGQSRIRTSQVQRSANREAAEARKVAARAGRDAQRQGREAMRAGQRAMAEARRTVERTARDLKRVTKTKRSPIKKKLKPTRATKARPKTLPRSPKITKTKRTKRKSPIRKALKSVFGTRSSYRRVKRRPLSTDLRRRVQEALRDMRDGRPFERVARSVGLERSRLRELLLNRNLAREKNGKLIATRRGLARMRFFSAGTIQTPLVTRRTATKIGRYMSAVSQFLPTGDVELLQPFEGEAITDVEGRRYVLETRPNVLYALNVDPEGFEEIYELVA